eukprot:705747-Prymnesium_polylepis.1
MNHLAVRFYDPNPSTCTPLSDLESREFQTLNLTIGGGMAVEHPRAIAARLRQKWRLFQRRCLEAVEKQGTIDLPHDYVSGDGYKLGSAISHFRAGKLFHDANEYASRVQWMKCLPGWHGPLSKSEAAKRRWQHDPHIADSLLSAKLARTEDDVKKSQDKFKATTSSDEWKSTHSLKMKKKRETETANGVEQKRIEKHMDTTSRKRKQRLDDCATEEERTRLLK